MFAGQMRRVLAIAGIALVFSGIGFAAYCVIGREPRPTVISDLKSPWAHSYRDNLHTVLAGELAIQVTGQINGKAIIHTSYGDMNLSSGKVDKIIRGAEYWCNWCDVRYEPIDVTDGHLAIKVGLGSNARWAIHPQMDTQPENYTGGWTTWYPGGKQKFSQGFYFQGRKRGSWTYWAENGQLMKTETWPEPK